MPANTIVIPLKAIYTNGNVTALGELNSGDKLSSDFLNLSDYVANADFQTALANTNAWIASVESGGSPGLVSNSFLTSTYTANADFQAALANTNAYIAYVAANAGEVSNAYLTSTFTTNTEFQSQLTTLNLSIDDRMQVANVTSAISTAIADLVDTAPATLDTLNELAAALGDDANFASTVTTSLAGKASNAAFQSALANTNAWIATVAATPSGLSNTEVENIVDSRINVLDLGDVVGTDGNAGQILYTNGDGTGYWSNNNPSVDTSSLATWSALTSTNTAIRTLISDRVQVANLNSTLADYWPSANVISYVDAELTSLVDAAPAALDTLNELAAALGDDANFSTTVTNSLASKATWSALTSTNTAIITLVDDRLQVANAASTYTTISAFNSALANTNAYIADVAVSAGEVSNAYLTSTYTTNTAFQSFVANTNAYIATVAAAPSGLSNTEVENIVDSRINVLDLGDVVGTDGNAGQILISYGDGTAYWSNNNPSVDLSGYVTNTAFQSALANTNAYVATKTDDTVVLATNTALRTLISDRMQVANVVSYTSKYLEVANVTTTDTSSLATWAALIATNTSIRSAISTEVANLVDSAPATLDTLNELAAALGDDANFASTITTSLAGKASNAAFQLALANTNAYIASVSAAAGDVSNTDFQAALANTNAYIASVAASAGLSEDDVSNLIDGRVNVLDLGDIVGTDGNAGQILISYGDGTAYWANNSGGGTVDLSSVSQSIVPSANVTYDLGTANNAWRDLYLSGNTIYLAGQAAISIDSSGSLVLPATAKIGSQAASARFASNTDLTSLSVSVNDRMQVANVTTAISTAIANLVDTAPSTLDTLNELAAALGDDANFASTVTTSLAGKASNAAFQSALANTNAYVATKTGDATVLATNTALRTLISDRMQVANVISYTAKYLEVANSASLGEVSNSYLTSTYTSNAVFQAFVANTNAAIAASSGGLSNSEVSDIVDSKLQVLDLGDVVGTDGNAGQILISYGDGTAYWSNNNPSVDLSGYVTNTAFQSFVANTNAAIANAGEVSNSYLTSTYTSNTTFQSFVANTNAYIATKTGDATVLATNTALRTLISDRVQVANLNSTLSSYWPSANVISYVNSEITSLIDAAPAALDTLNELAAALGDDANFSATVTTSLASKAANSYVNSTFVSNTAFQSFVANTNAYIAASSGSGGLSNSEVSDIVDSKLQVLDIGDIVGTDGGVNQVLLSNGDGTSQWGSAPSGMQEFAFTASNNQTTFTGADDYSSTLSYTAGKLLVFLNGVKLARLDFQANNGTSVVFNDGVAANDYVEFVAF
jgi:hypothetical protein